MKSLNCRLYMTISFCLLALMAVSVQAVTINNGDASTNSSTVTLTFSPPSGCYQIYARNSDGTGANIPITSPQPWTLLPVDGVQTVTLTYYYTYQYVCGSYCCHHDMWGNCDQYCDTYCTGHGSYQDSDSILLSTGSASSTISFNTPSQYSTGAAPWATVHSDFNRDGNPDLAITNYTGNILTIIRGNGDGSFQSPISYSSGISSPLGLATGDFNRDSIPDLAVANYGSSSVAIFLGNGDATFQSGINYATGANPYSVCIADFNRDSIEDLAVANLNSSNVSILRGNGDGTFQSQTTYSVAGTAASITTGDFNRDGKADLAVANYGSANVSVLIGNGDGTFQTAVNYAAGTNPFSVSTGDYDNDGILDLFIANYGNNCVSILKGNSGGTFASAVNYATGSQPRTVIPYDFNRDGRLDLAVACYGGGVSVLRGYANGTFYRTDFTAGPTLSGITASDFDRDGKTDLAVVSYGNNIAYFLMNNGTIEPAGAFEIGTDNTVNEDAQWIVTGDFNRDGKLDIATADYSSSSISILLGNGDETFQAASTISVGGHSSCLAVGDFNRDGIADLAVAKPADASIQVLTGNGDGTFGVLIEFGTTTAGSNPKYIAVGDIDRDGWPDLVISHSLTAGQISVYRNSGGGFPYFYKKPAGNTPGALTIGDYDRNGTLDVAVLNFGDDNLGAWINCTGSGCSYWTTRATGYGPLSLTQGDFNRDGKTDLAIVNGDDATLSTTTGTGTGGFNTSVDYMVGSYPKAVVTADFNRDGKLDLGASGTGGCSLETLSGKAGGTFDTPTIYDYGQISALTSGDFNNDGKVDMAGIVGTNIVRIFPNANSFNTVTVTKTGSGDGTITSSPSGISCGSGCTSSFSRSSTVTLTATADSGSAFVGWGGDCTSCGTNPDCEVQIGGDLNCTANFVPDPVAYWTFDDDTARDTIGHHDGTITGTGVTFAPGKVGDAVSFSNGQSYIKVPGFNLAHITVSAWVNSSAYGYYTSMVTKSYYDNQWASPWTTWQIWLSENTAAPGVNGATLGSWASPETINMGQWYLIAFTYDGTDVKLYVNGVLKSSQPASTPGDLPNTTGNIYIGKPEFANHSFTGLLDEVAIWDRALTADEISRQYQNGLAGEGYPVKTFSLSANAQGNGTGTVECATEAIAYTFPEASTATATGVREGVSTILTATGGTGSTASWEGTCVSAGGTEAGNGSSVATCTFTGIDTDKTVSATFTGKAGEASKSGSPLTITKASGTAVQLSYTPAGCAIDHAIYWGESDGSATTPVFTYGQCGFGTTGEAQVDPGDPPPGSFFYFVVTGNNGSEEGSYGKSSSNVERPNASGVTGCTWPQDTSSTCE